MKRETLRKALYALALLLIAATWPRDDSGTPAAQCSFIGSAGTPTLCSTTDALPVLTGAPTQASNDPTGFGKNWFASTTGLTSGDAAAMFVNDQTAVAIKPNGTGTALETYLSQNSGRTWSLIATSAGDTCAQVNAGLYFGGAFLIGCNADGVNDGLFRSPSGFDPWTRLDMPGVIGFSTRSIAAQGSTVLVFGPDGNICRSTNSGSSFSSCVDPGAVSTAGRQGLASPSLNIWLVGDTIGNVSRSTDDGLTWTTVLAMGGVNGFVRCLSATVCLASNGGTTIWRSTNAGTTWTAVFSPGAVTGLGFVGFVDFGSGVVNAVDQDVVYRSADFGATWTFQVTLPVVVSSNLYATLEARGGRGLAGAAFTGGAVLYSPVVGAGETIIAGQNGNRWEINASGEGETSTVIRDSTQANAATVTVGGRIGALALLGGGAQRTCSEPAANTAASISVTGVASQRIVLFDYIAFYTTAPAAAQTLTVTSAAVNIWLDIVNGANTPTQRSFSTGLLPTDGNTLTVTLPAGGAGVVGKLCAAITGPFIP